MSEDRDLKAEFYALREKAACHQNDPGYTAELASAFFACGKELYENDKELAVRSLEEARTLFGRLPLSYLNSVKYKTFYKMTLSRLLSYYKEENSAGGVFELYEDMLNVDMKRAEAEPENNDLIRTYLSNVDRAAGYFEERGDTDRFLRLYGKKLGFYRKLILRDPSDSHGYILNLNLDLDKVIAVNREKNDIRSMIELDEEKTDVCKRITELYPDYYPAFSGAAAAYRELGELTGNKEYYTCAKEYAKHCPDDPVCKKILDDLT